MKLKYKRSNENSLNLPLPLSRIYNLIQMCIHDNKHTSLAFHGTSVAVPRLRCSTRLVVAHMDEFFIAGFDIKMS